MKYLLIIVGGVVGVVALVIGLSALFALPVMWLWNFVVPHIFGLKELDFLHAWALNVLCGLMFKSGTYTNEKSDK
jgi:hypothetical protein